VLFCHEKRVLRALFSIVFFPAIFLESGKQFF